MVLSSATKNGILRAMVDEKFFTSSVSAVAIAEELAKNYGVNAVQIINFISNLKTSFREDRPPRALANNPTYRELKEMFDEAEKAEAAGVAPRPRSRRPVSRRPIQKRQHNNDDVDFADELERIKRQNVVLEMEMRMWKRDIEGKIDRLQKKMKERMKRIEAKLDSILELAGVTKKNADNSGHHHEDHRQQRSAARENHQVEGEINEQVVNQAADVVPALPEAPEAVEKDEINEEEEDDEDSDDQNATPSSASDEDEDEMEEDEENH